MMIPFLCSLFIMFIISNKVLENTSKSALGAVFGRYTTPIIQLLQDETPISISMKIDSNI